MHVNFKWKTESQNIILWQQSVLIFPKTNKTDDKNTIRFSFSPLMWSLMWELEVLYLHIILYFLWRVVFDAFINCSVICEYVKDLLSPLGGPSRQEREERRRTFSSAASTWRGDRVYNLIGRFNITTRLFFVWYCEIQSRSSELHLSIASII